MNLFFNPIIHLETKSFIFSPEESKHISKVLRKVSGDKILVTDGNGIEWLGELLNSGPKNVEVKRISAKIKKDFRYDLEIAIAPTKSNDRVEWFLEKATEIGIDEITPIICSNSERRIVKLERFEKIIQSAMKQSLKFTLPKLNAPIKFNKFIQQDFEGKVYIAHCEEQNKTTLKSIIDPADKITILIGPEGDFSTEEIQKSLAKEFTPISLGESGLRTETAALVAVNIVSFINE